MTPPDRVLIQTQQSERGHVATLTINHPERANCLSRETMRALITAIEALRADADLRVLIVTGTGARSFVAGADIDEMATLDGTSARAFITLVHRCCDGLRHVPVPVIARINGAVFGAGLELAAACDFRIAANDVSFGMPEVRLGMPSVVEAALLPRLIGWGRTRRLLLTGETIDAPLAVDWGLVEEVVPAAALDAAVERAVAAILSAGPVAVRLQKHLIGRWEAESLRDSIATGIDSFAEAWSGEEPRLMTAAFLARRRRHRTT